LKLLIRVSYLLLSATVLFAASADDPAFVLLDGRTGRTIIENAQRARERFSPCSTYKIPNSLIALDTGVAPDAAFPLQYDPKRDGEQSGVWARDHDLRSAIRGSVVWYYQELARRIGPERMRKYVDGFDYGNRDLSGGIDRFWLGQGLRISAEEQVAFLQRFYEGRLPVSPRSTAIVKDILLLETTGEYRWYGKTGTCFGPNASPVAWHVGFVEREGKVSYYALNFGGESLSELIARRPKLLREKLAKARLIDPNPPTARQQMEARIQTAISAFPGAVSLFAKNLDTGQTFGIRENERVRTASTIKLPIMTAVFSAVAQGRANWDELIELRDEDKVSGSGVARELSGGLKLPLRDLVHLMIVVSDNTATNLVLDRFTADFVNAEIDKLGLKQTRALRKILGDGNNLKPVASGHSREGLMEEFRRFGLGVSTPGEMVMLLEKLERGEVVSPEASRQMLAILNRQQFKDGIGRQLQNELVASKSGSLDRLRSDVGVVNSIGGRIAIAVTVDDMRRTDYSPDNAGSVLISQLTGMLLEGLSTQVVDLGSPEKVIELHGEMDHVQGIEVDGDHLWVTWVDRKNKTGHLGEFELSTGRLIRSVSVQNGERFHPGGLAAEGESLWLPVAEYKPNSSSLIQRRNKKTLELEAEFEVPDHVGCVAAAGGQLYGGNWDARQIYTWDRSGRLLSKRDNAGGNAFQDLKAPGGQLIGGGIRPDGGAIDWMDPSDLRLLRRVRAGKSSRGILLTHEGMAISGDHLYLLPEDSPSRLFVFPLPR
jgi:beta-lactamase class D/beta-lactamase class A